MNILGDCGNNSCQEYQTSGPGTGFDQGRSSPVPRSLVVFSSDSQSKRRMPVFHLAASRPPSSQQLLRESTRLFPGWVVRLVLVPFFSAWDPSCHACACGRCLLSFVKPVFCLQGEEIPKDVQLVFGPLVPWAVPLHWY